MDSADVPQPSLDALHAELERAQHLCDRLAQVLLDHPPSALPSGDALETALTEWDSVLDEWEHIRGAPRAKVGSTAHPPTGVLGVADSEQAHSDQRFTEQELLAAIVERWGSRRSLPVDGR